MNFLQEMARLRQEVLDKGWDPDFTARQFVDDYFRASSVSLHGVQGAVQLLLKGMSVTYIVTALRTATNDPEQAPQVREGADALIRLLEDT